MPRTNFSSEVPDVDFVRVFGANLEASIASFANDAAQKFTVKAAGETKVLVIDAGLIVRGIALHYARAIVPSRSLSRFSRDIKSL